MKKCSNQGCNNRKKKNNGQCSKCVMKAYRARYPEKAAYNVLKYNAWRRGKTFTLTFEQFLAFNKQHNYVELKGRTAEDMSIDRIQNDKGYEAGNIQPMSVSDNAKKWIWQQIDENGF